MIKPINWNEVTVGETDIVKGSEFMKIIGLYGDFVWASHNSVICTRNKSDLTDWAIYDPWEEITEECEWSQMVWNHIGWVIRYKGNPIECFNQNYKSDGRRVWKRKEG